MRDQYIVEVQDLKTVRKYKLQTPELVNHLIIMLYAYSPEAI